MSLKNNDLFVVQRGDKTYKVPSSLLQSSYSATATTYIGDSPPTPAIVGDLWWSSISSNLFVYYDDGFSTQWVDASPSQVDIDYGRLESYIENYVDNETNLDKALRNQNGVAVSGDYAEIKLENNGAAIDLNTTLDSTGVNQGARLEVTQGDARSLMDSDGHIILANQQNPQVRFRHRRTNDNFGYGQITLTPEGNPDPADERTARDEDGILILQSGKVMVKDADNPDGFFLKPGGSDGSIPISNIDAPTVLTPPDGAGIGGDITYTPKTSAITDVALIQIGIDPTPYKGASPVYTGNGAFNAATPDAIFEDGGKWDPVFLTNLGSDGSASVTFPVPIDNPSTEDFTIYYRIGGAINNTGTFKITAIGSLDSEDTGFVADTTINPGKSFTVSSSIGSLVSLLIERTGQTSGNTLMMIQQIDRGSIAIGKGYEANAELTLTDSNTYNNADGSLMSDPISTTFAAGDTVNNGAGATGTLTADADDAGPTIALTDVTGTWSVGDEVINDKEFTEFGPSADDLEFTSSVPSGTNITTYGNATWEVDTNSLFGSPMTATKTITAGAIQELLPSERGAITLEGDTEYYVRVRYDSAEPDGVESFYSDVNHFKTKKDPEDGWNLATSTENNSWNSVVYANGKFVAVSTNGTNRVMYSDNGINWNAASAAEPNTWISVTYGDNKFVAVATSGTNRVMYSDNDGETWTGVTSAIADSASWRSVTYGDNKFVAVASGLPGSRRVMYSSNGINWDAATPAQDTDWLEVTYGIPSTGIYAGQGLFVAVTNTGTYRSMYSTDGINWNVATTVTGDIDWKSVNFGDGRFVAVGREQSMYSTDGINWNVVSITKNWLSVAYGNGRFVAVSESSGDYNQAMYSSDGSTWTLTATPTWNKTWMSVTYGGDKFVAVGLQGTLMWSETGKGLAATFTAYDAENNKPVNDLSIVDRFGVDPTADNTHLGIYELTEQPTGAVVAYVPEGDKYKPIIDLSQPLEQAQAEAAQANARLDEANQALEELRSDFETRIASLEADHTTLMNNNNGGSSYGY